MGGSEAAGGITVSTTTRSSPEEAIPRSTVIPDKSDDLPKTTLGAILSVKQTGLGSAGLKKLVDRYGRG